MLCGFLPFGGVCRREKRDCENNDGGGNNGDGDGGNGDGDGVWNRS